MSLHIKNRLWSCFSATVLSFLDVVWLFVFVLILLTASDVWFSAFIYGSLLLGKFRYGYSILYKFFFICIFY